MNELELVRAECEKHEYCQHCPFYSMNSGQCSFYKNPKVWEMPNINTAVKLIKPENIISRKRSKKDGE